MDLTYGGGLPNVSAGGVSSVGNTSGNTGTTQGTIVFAGGNNITLSQSTNASGATVTISGPNTAAGGSFSAGVSGGNTSGNIGITGTQVFFAGGNNVTLSQATDANGATITVSGANTSAFSAGVSNLGQTSGSTGVTGTRIVLVGTNGIGLSQSTNASGATISAQPAPYVSNWMPIFPSQTINSVLSPGVMLLYPDQVPWPVTATAVNILINVSQSSSSNSSMAATLSMLFCIYTRNASSLSSASSGSATYVWTNTSNNSMASITGPAYASVPINVNMTPGEYCFGVALSSATANTNWATVRIVLNETQLAGAGNFMGPFLSGSSATNQPIPGWGNVLAGASTISGSIAFSQITGAGGNILQPILEFCNVTF